MGHSLWIAEHRRHELLWVTICLRVIHHQSQGLAMPRLEGRYKIMMLAYLYLKKAAGWSCVILGVTAYKKILLIKVARIYNHWKYQWDCWCQPSIGDSSHRTSPSTALCRYLLGKWEDSLWREESTRGVCCNLGKIRVRVKQINWSKSKYSYDVWSGKCLICNLEEGSPWPRLSKTLCQGWGEPIILAIFFITPRSIVCYYGQVTHLWLESSA